MEITGIYQAQKVLIDSLKNENADYLIRYIKLPHQYAILETKYSTLSEECDNLHKLCEDRSLEILTSLMTMEPSAPLFLPTHTSPELSQS